ncbi:1037_t:CDS:2, partial [Funneliformis caledonium]
HIYLSACLPLITPKETIRSLTVLDEPNEIDYQEFLLMSRNVKEMVRLGSESFPDTFLNPKKADTNLTKEILALLTEYYSNAYGKDFVVLSNIHIAPSGSISIMLKYLIGRTL